MRGGKIEIQMTRVGDICWNMQVNGDGSTLTERQVTQEKCQVTQRCLFGLFVLLISVLPLVKKEASPDGPIRFHLILPYTTGPVWSCQIILGKSSPFFFFFNVFLFTFFPFCRLFCFLSLYSIIFSKDTFTFANTPRTEQLKKTTSTEIPIPPKFIPIYS